MSTPPAEGGAFETTSWPRYAALTGRRWMTRYAARSVRLMRPPRWSTSMVMPAGNVAAVEGIGSVRRDRRERLREISHHHAFAAGKAASLAVDPAPVRIVAEHGIEDIVEQSLRGVQFDTRSGKDHGRLDQSSPWDRAV